MDLAQERDQMRMFLEEARIASSLGHPNIVRAFDIDWIGSVSFILVQYIHGPSLWRLARRSGQQGSVRFGHIAFIIAEIARGLHYAHFRGEEVGLDAVPRLVHRDVSLQNILVSSEGVPKLIDFGIAAMTDARCAGRAETHLGMFSI